MPIQITMPRLSDTMESGTVIKWNVSEGDAISSGDVIADVETDKATMELTVYDEGTVAALTIPEGQLVEVGTVIALLAEEGEDLQDVKAQAGGVKSTTSGDGAAERASRRGAEEATPTDPQPPAAAVEKGAGREQRPEKPVSSATAAENAQETAEKSDEESGERSGEESGEEEPSSEEGGDNGRIRVSPVARRMADEHDINIRTLQGSGPGGRIIKRDVLKAIESAQETAASVPPSAAPAEREPVRREEPAEIEPAARAKGVGAGERRRELATRTMPSSEPVLEERRIQLTSMRQTIARRLVESATSAPHYQVSMTFNMDPLLELRKTLNEQLAPMNVKLSVNDFLVRCCALAMHQHPDLNASWGGDHVLIHGEVNIGVAIAVGPEKGGGLVVGVIRNTDQKSLRAISHESRMLAEKARTRGLSIDEMSDSTFTLSNLGMFGVDHFTAIINPPNSAILAVGAALQKPVVRDGELAVGHEMTATLNSDHRVIDGAMAAQYLQTLKQFIENPATLMV